MMAAPRKNALTRMLSMLFVRIEIRYLDYHHPRQMPDRRHHDPHVEGKLIRTGLLEELPVEEHAGSLAELNDRA